MNMPGLLPWLQEWSQEVYCSLVELHVLCAKIPGRKSGKSVPNGPQVNYKLLQEGLL